MIINLNNESVCDVSAPSLSSVNKNFNIRTI